jgi:hypothetical protein
MPKMALGDVASWHQFYMAAKPSHVGVDLDGLAYILQLSDDGTWLPNRRCLVPSCCSGRLSRG